MVNASGLYPEKSPFESEWAYQLASVAERLKAAVLKTVERKLHEFESYRWRHGGALSA